MDSTLYLTHNDVSDQQEVFKLARRHHRAGRLADAERIYQEILERQPNHAGALHLLGVVAGQRGQFDRAIELIERAVRVDPSYAEAFKNLGVLLMQGQRIDEALTAFSRAIQIKPDFATALLARGHALGSAGRLEEALRDYRRAAQINAGLPEACLGMAVVLARLSRFDEAMECHARAASLQPGAALTHHAMGEIVLLQHGAAAAIEHYRRAVDADPVLLPAWNSLGAALLSQGNFDEAAKCFRKMLEISPDSALARQQLVAITRQKAGQNEMEPLLRLLNQQGLRDDQRMNAEFALGTALDDLERYDEAFEHFAIANSLGKKQRALAGERFDRKVLKAQIDELIETFTADFFQKRSGWGVPSQIPVFIVGMPRSGTTLVHQIAASHPQVYGADELDSISQIAGELGGPGLQSVVAERSSEKLETLANRHLSRLSSLNSNASRIIDKTPGNLQFLGLIALLFPSARVIVCRRDPRDTCISCYFQSFARGHAFSYDLADCGQYHREVDRLIAHWLRVRPVAMMETHYEAVVADLEGQSRRLIEFLGLPWDAACLEFQKSPATVRTLSAWQVRQPIYSRSVGRWKNYERHLRALFEALD